MSEPGRSAASRWSPPGLVALVIGVWTPAYLTWPFGWDQGIFAWVGDVVVRGGMPYRDAWEMRGPTAPSVFALTQWVFGRHAWAIRLVDLLLLCAGAWGCQRIARQWMPVEWARGAGVVLVLWYLSGAYWHTAQPDAWVAFGMLVVVAWIVSAPPGRRWHWLAAGGFAALAVLVKPLYAVLLGVFALEHWRGVLAGDRRRRLGADLRIALGFVAVGGAFVGWLAARDALESAIEVAVVYPARVYTGSLGLDLLGRAEGLVEFLRNGTVAAPLCAAACVGAWWLWRERRGDALRMGGWALAAFAVVVVQNRFFHYHWLPVQGPLVLLGFAGLYALYSRAGPGDAGSLARGFAVATLGVVLAGAAIHPARELAEWLRYAIGSTDRLAYLDHFGDTPGAEARAVEWLRTETGPDEPVLVYGWSTSVLFLAERRSPTRFGYPMPLLVGTPALRDRYRQELLRDLAADPPVAIVVTPPSLTILGPSSGIEPFPELDRLIATEYEVAFSYADLTLYRAVRP